MSLNACKNTLLISKTLKNPKKFFKSVVQYYTKGVSFKLLTSIKGPFRINKSIKGIKVKILKIVIITLQSNWQNTETNKQNNR